MIGQHWFAGSAKGVAHVSLTDQEQSSSHAEQGRPTEQDHQGSSDSATQGIVHNISRATCQN